MGAELLETVAQPEWPASACHGVRPTEHACPGPEIRRQEAADSTPKEGDVVIW